MPKPRTTDRRGRLAANKFSYRATKDGRVFISWRGRPVTVLSGNDAMRFLSRIECADGKQVQLLMAKATGHFKH